MSNDRRWDSTKCKLPRERGAKQSVPHRVVQLKTKDIIFSRKCSRKISISNLPTQKMEEKSMMKG
jgi:hypothetical protein